MMREHLKNSTASITEFGILIRTGKIYGDNLRPTKSFFDSELFQDESLIKLRSPSSHLIVK